MAADVPAPSDGDAAAPPPPAAAASTAGGAAGQQPQPATWGALCNAYRGSFGSRAFATVASPGAARQQRFARSVPGMCPLAEVRHPLYAAGEELHVPSERAR
jgi:hypothetical protein